MREGFINVCTNCCGAPAADVSDIRVSSILITELKFQTTETNDCNALNRPF